MVSSNNSANNGHNLHHEAAPYERVIFNDSVGEDERARELLFGGARAQLAQQQYDRANAVVNASKQQSAKLMRVAQLPNQRRSTAIGVQATSSSSGSENDSASYSHHQLLSKNGSGTGYRPPVPPPLSMQSLQQVNVQNNHNTLGVETQIAGPISQPNPQRDHRILAVLHAISNGRVSMLRSVWNSDLPMYVDEHKNTVYHWCAKYEGAAKCLKWLIKHSQIPLSSRNFRGELCTHVAARHGVLSCLKVALTSANVSGGQMHSSESSGSSGGSGQPGTTDQLFSATEKDKRGFTILHLAVIKQRFPIVRWLTKQTFSTLLVRIADNNSNLPLHYAALRGDKKMAQVLLKKNKDMLNLRNVSGATPLHVAAFEGRSVGFVQWLVEEAGADATAVMESGVNLLHVAAAGGSIPVVRYLLSTTRQPAEAVLSRSQDGSTIFHFAAANGHASMLQWLWTQRVNSSSRTGSAGLLPSISSTSSSNSNRSPLPTAIAAGIHLRNSLGNSPVHAAAEAGQAGTFRQLVEFGADIFGKNKSGFTALELALVNKNPALARLADDIRRLLLDPTFASSPDAEQVPGHNHLLPVTLPNRSNSQPARHRQTLSNRNNNNLASSLSGYHSNLASSFNALHLPDESHHGRPSDTRLQMQLHMPTGELGTLDGSNENDDDVLDNGEEGLVRRVNENVFLRQEHLPPSKSRYKSPSSTSYSLSTWKDKIFSQKGRRAASSATNINSLMQGPGHLDQVPELSTLMRNRTASAFYRSSDLGNEIVGEQGDYWNRLSNDIRRLLNDRRQY